MAFWNSNTVEPKRAFRFLMDIGAQGTDTLASYFIKTVKKPNFGMDGAQEVKYIGHTFKYPGRVKWSTVTFTIAAFKTSIGKTLPSVMTGNPSSSSIKSFIAWNIAPMSSLSRLANCVYCSMVNLSWTKNCNSSP